MAEPSGADRTKLQDAEQVALLNSILESSTEYSIVAMDLGGTILAWHEGARRTYGYAAGEVVGKATTFILHDPDDVRSGRAQAILDEARQVGKEIAEFLGRTDAATLSKPFDLREVRAVVRRALAHLHDPHLPATS